MPLTETTQWLRANPTVTSGKVGVDLERKAILGVIAAQAGPFKTEGRGEFDGKSLRAIVKMINAERLGLKSRYTHPDVSSDGLGKFLGRVSNARLDTIEAKGETIEVVRVDHQLDPTSFNTPNGNLGQYVLDLARSDPYALMTSLVLQVNEEYRFAKDGSPEVGEDGKALPPLWRPTVLHALDIVDDGDATTSLLATDTLPDAAVRKGAELLDRMFAGAGPGVIRARCTAWLDRYLDRRFGDLHEARVEGAKERALQPSAFAVGEKASWLVEYPDLLCAEREMGVVQKVEAGPLQIPGSTLTLAGTVEDPAVLLQAVEDGMEEPRWHLVLASRLTKIVPDIMPGESYAMPLGVDEAVCLEIELMEME